VAQGEDGAGVHRLWGVGGCASAAVRQQGFCRLALGRARRRGEVVGASTVGRWQDGGVATALVPAH